MSDNPVSVAADELKKWLDVLQQLIKEKQAYDAKQAAKIDKMQTKLVQEQRHEQMMAKFDKLANQGTDVTELKKAVAEAQKEVETLRKQLEGPEAKIDADKPKIGGHRKTGTDAGLEKNAAGSWKSAVPTKKVEGLKTDMPKIKMGK